MLLVSNEQLSFDPAAVYRVRESTRQQEERVHLLLIFPEQELQNLLFCFCASTCGIYVVMVEATAAKGWNAAVVITYTFKHTNFDAALSGIKT